MSVRRKTTLHLLYVRGLEGAEAEVAVQTVTTDRMTYYGGNIAELAAEAGQPALPLRRLHFRADGEPGGVRRAEVAWHLEALGDASGLPWQPIANLPERERGWAQAALTPPPEIPWFHPGWFADALAWVDAELAAQGRTRQAEPTVLKHWQISALWRVGTEGGDVYFKAVPAFFAREVEVTPWLAAELPGAAPPVLAADLPRRFLLLEDAGGDLGEQMDLAAVTVHVARLQRASVPLLPDWTLRGLHLRDRGPDYVRGWLDALLTDDALLTGQEGGFTPQEAAELRAARPRLETALERLGRSPLPLTLGHGDLHGGNVAVQVGPEGQQVGPHHTLLDWSDACLTHPFMDLNPAYFTGQEGDPPPPEALVAAEDATLAVWEDVTRPEELRPLLRDGRLAGELFRALSYVDGIQPAAPDKAEWRGAHLGHLRRALELLRD